MTTCISRVTAIDARCYFADKKHKFFLEMRCDRICTDPSRRICFDCSIKTTSIIQWCRKIDHGTVFDPIPDRSHIFGGNWYEDGVRKWGAPSAEDIQTAMEHQRDARKTESQEVSVSKVKEPSPSMEKPPAKRGRKPKAAAVPLSPPVETESVVEPSAALAPSVGSVTSSSVGSVPLEPAPKPKRTKKPKVVTPVKMADPSMVQKEVVLPTHMEQTRDVIDTDGFDIEYVKLSAFTVGDNTYFRDSKKNKLYKKIKEKSVGDYVGRYDPSTETIDTEIPDSDDESE